MGFCKAGFAVTGNFVCILPATVSICTGEKHQKSVRCTGCYFVWLVLKKKEKKIAAQWLNERMCVCACTHMWLASVLNWEGSWVFAKNSCSSRTAIYILIFYYIYIRLVTVIISLVSVNHFSYLVLIDITLVWKWSSSITQGSSCELVFWLKILCWVSFK